MQRNEILAGIQEVAQTHVGWTGALTTEQRLVEDLGLDSLKSLTLALEVENRFRVALDEAGEIVTIGDLVEAIAPRFMRLSAYFNVRGGIYTTVVAEHRADDWTAPSPVYLPTGGDSSADEH